MLDDTRGTPGIIVEKLFPAMKMQKHVAGMDAMLNKQSGLIGLSELSNDCRELETAAAKGHAGAKLALDVFAHRLARCIGGLAMALRRLDAVVFTGGIGENSARLRAACLERLDFLGISIDAARNEAGSGDRTVSADASKVTVLALATNEELIVARRAYACLTASRSAA